MPLSLDMINPFKNFLGENQNSNEIINNNSNNNTEIGKQLALNQQPSELIGGFFVSFIIIYSFIIYLVLLFIRLIVYYLLKRI